MEADRNVLTDTMWGALEAVLHEVRDPRGAPSELDERTFVEAVLFLCRTGSPWRDLPSRFGRWSAVYMRFRRWEDAGVWEALWQGLAQGRCPELLTVFLDSTSIPVHPHAAGARKKTTVQARLLAARGEA
jgi:transposase